MAFVLESFSFLLIPWYLYCTAWIGRELFALSGMTFWEFVQKGQGRVPMSTSHHRSRSRRNRAVLALLMETSSDPEVTSQQREEWSQSLPYGGERCTLTRDGVTYDVLYWGNTVVYAYAPEGSEEITDLLVELHYIRP